ncbi:MAG: hypothetical protein ACOCQ1_03685 [Halanaerobiaceae bacterium]
MKKRIPGWTRIKKSGGLKFFIIAMLFLGLSGLVVPKVLALESVSSSLDVNIDIPHSVSMNFSGLGSFGTSSNNESWSDFDFSQEEPLIVDVKNPLNNYSESIEWELTTNYPQTSISFASIGYDGEDYKSLTEPNINEFVRYIIGFNDLTEEFGPGGSLSNISGYYNGTFTIEYDPELADKLWCANEAGQYRDIIQVTIAGEPTANDGETAFGGDSPGEGPAWWYYYDTDIGGTQTIWAGQYMNAGTVEYRPGPGKIEIVLDDGWSLQNGTEAVKIQGYNNLPDSRPAAGLFTTYSGSNLTIDVPDFRFFVIHLDLIYN